METDYSLILLLILNGNQPSDSLKDLCENFLNRYCNQEGMVLYSKLLRQISDKEGVVEDIEIEG